MHVCMHVCVCVCVCVGVFHNSRNTPSFGLLNLEWRNREQTHTLQAHLHTCMRVCVCVCVCV